MKAGNIFYGLALLFLAYGLNLPTLSADIFGYKVEIPNPFYALGQWRIPFLNIPAWIGIGLLGLVCILFAFESDKPQVIVQERTSK